MVSDFGAGASEAEFFADGFIFVGDGDEDGSHWFSRGAAGWAGDAGDPDSKVCFSEPTDILRHFTSYSLRNRAPSSD